MLLTDNVLLSDCFKQIMLQLSLYILYSRLVSGSQTFTFQVHPLTPCRLPWVNLDPPKRTQSPWDPLWERLSGHNGGPLWLCTVAMSVVTIICTIVQMILLCKWCGNGCFGLARHRRPSMCVLACFLSEGEKKLFQPPLVKVTSGSGAYFNTAKRANN